jgi:hypothetical protein
MDKIVHYKEVSLIGSSEYYTTTYCPFTEKWSVHYREMEHPLQKGGEFIIHAVVPALGIPR